MTQVQTRKVSLTANAPVEIEAGVVLPAGTYTGEEKKLGVTAWGGQSWTKPRYMLPLTAEQLNAMGAKVSATLTSHYDVTAFVKRGQILVS
jgi:hypothetical protein